MDLETELTGLCVYGEPKLSLMSGGWFCMVNMNTNAAGASFDVKSDFNMKSPSTAVSQCKQRIIAAVGAVNEAAVKAAVTGDIKRIKSKG